MIRDIDYCYDPRIDMIWITWTDLSMLCAYTRPFPREVDIVRLVDSILLGEQNW